MLGGVSCSVNAGLRAHLLCGVRESGVELVALKLTVKPVVERDVKQEPVVEVRLHALDHAAVAVEQHAAADENALQAEQLLALLLELAGWRGRRFGGRHTAGRGGRWTQGRCLGGGLVGTRDAREAPLALFASWNGTASTSRTPS